MALVDSLLKLMSAQSADVMVIPSSEPPWLDRRGETRPLSMPALGRDMVEAMVEELVEPAARERLEANETVELAYEADDGGRYLVGCEFSACELRVDLGALERAAPEHWAADGVHPTMAGHHLMAKTWMEVVKP